MNLSYPNSYTFAGGCAGGVSYRISQKIYFSEKLVFFQIKQWILFTFVSILCLYWFNMIFILPHQLEIFQYFMKTMEFCPRIIIHIKSKWLITKSTILNIYEKAVFSLKKCIVINHTQVTFYMYSLICPLPNFHTFVIFMLIKYLKNCIYFSKNVGQNLWQYYTILFIF